MDESREYLKMCEEASEIQADHVFKPGDVAGSSYYCIQLLITKEGQQGRNGDGLAWLPRIGQLLEILGGRMVAMDKLWHVEKIAPSEYYQQFNSMEQILLAIYMEEKHGKVWCGNTWKTKERA